MCPDNGFESATASAVFSPDNVSKRTYTVEEVAILLQISKSRAYELCKQDLFKIVKVGRAVRVSKLSFDEWLDTQ